MNKTIDELRAQLKLTMLTKGKKIKNVSIEEIPKDWKSFVGKEDIWINVDFPESENATGCIFIGREGSIFDPHIHKGSLEHILILNEGGEMEVITDTYAKTVKYPDSILIEKNTPHAVRFIKETKLFILWHPKFEKGWDADFVEN